jgi:hypothetical protein
MMLAKMMLAKMMLAKMMLAKMMLAKMMLATGYQCGVSSSLGVTCCFCTNALSLSCTTRIKLLLSCARICSCVILYVKIGSCEV